MVLVLLLVLLLVLVMTFGFSVMDAGIAFPVIGGWAGAALMYDGSMGTTLEEAADRHGRAKEREEQGGDQSTHDHDANTRIVGARCAMTAGMPLDVSSHGQLYRRSGQGIGGGDRGLHRR
jgi:hypothetical protein